MSGIIRVKIEALNAGTIVNKLIDSGVYIKNLKEKTKYICFDIYQKDEVILKKICKRFHRRFEIISRNNFVNHIKKLKYYFGFFVAVTIMSIFLFTSNLYVYKINVLVSSDADFDLEKINNFLKENNIVSGMQKKDVDIDKLQNLIISTQDNVAGCKIKQNGGVLDIVIYPGLLKENVSTENIYSKFDAIITDIEIYAGKTNLKVGDLVKKGDLLIENNNGAAGKITGKVYLSDYIIYNENQYEKVKTGNIIKKRSILIFNKNLNKSLQFDGFSNFFEENCVFYVSKNLFLPLQIIETTYSEFELKDIVVTFESQEENLKNKLYNSLIQKVGDEKITNVTYSLVRENNLVRLDCFIECEIDLIK